MSTRCAHSTCCSHIVVACMQIAALPEACVHLGAASVSLDDVHAFNERRDVRYELNVNDCRHYVNHLAHLTTGACPAAACLP